MKKLISAALLCFSVFSVKAEVKELERSGNQLYEDGFYRISWNKYQQAFNEAGQAEDKLRLLEKLTRTSEKAGKEKDTLTHLSAYLSSTKNIPLEAEASLLLNLAALQIKVSLFKEAAANSAKVLKNLSKLPKDIQEKALDTAVFAYLKNSDPENASKLIEQNLKLFSDSEKAELLNARIKILMNQFVSAITILEKHTESQKALPHFLALWAYLKSGDTAKSYEIYNKHLKTVLSPPDPAFTGVMIKLAESTYKEKLKESIEVLDKALSLEADVNMIAYLHLKKSELLVLSDNTPEALKALELFLKNFPKSNKTLQASLQLAELYFRSENQDLVRSASLLNSIIDSNPENKKMMYDALVLRAGVKQAAGTLKDAAGDYTTAAELAKAQKYEADLITHPLYQAGMTKYIEAEKSSFKEAFNDAANSFYSAASVKSSYRLKAALMQVQALRKAESFTAAVLNIKNWLKIFPQSIDLNYLLGISLLEDRKTADGVKALKKFAILHPADQRVPDTYIHSLRALIYDSNASKQIKNTEKLIAEFEQNLSRKSELSEIYDKAAPHILHLKAIYSWKNNYRVAALKYWQEFLEKYQSHSLAAEVHLWLAFKSKTSEKPLYAEALNSYSMAVSLLPESSLKAYGLTQMGKTLKESNQLEKATETLENAVKIYKSMELNDSLTEELAALLFYSGDLYSRMGLYEGKAAEAFTEALKLTSQLSVKLALRGRIADCIFSQSARLSGRDEKETEYIENILKALEIYKEITLDKNSGPAVREQALYKMAKCHETLGGLKDKSHTNKHLALAVDSYKELFFSFHNDMKKGRQRDPYYFCRAGYDLARLHLNFEEAALMPAINTYKILWESGFPGTAHAKEMYQFLSSAQKKLDDE